MIDLLKNFSLQQIIIFLILLGLAIKGIVSFFDWVQNKNKQVAKKINQPIQWQTNIEKNNEQIQDLKKLIQLLQDKVDLLIQSDKDDIKAFIVREHHQFYFQRKWIDDFSLDCIEKRYNHYKEEGGNSFIETLMDEIRALPRQEINKETSQTNQK